MKSFFFLFVLAAALSCSHIPTPDAQLNLSREAVVKFYTLTASSSGFHIGQGIIVTAAHCYDEDELLFKELPQIQESSGRKQKAEILIIDKEADILIASVEQWPAQKLQLEDDISNMREGDQLITIGFPKYYAPYMTFDVGHLKGFFIFKGRRFASVDVTSVGYSGGPLISMRTGKVIAIQHKLINKFDDIGSIRSQDQHHHWLGLAVLSTDVLDLINKTKNGEQK